MKGRHGGEGGGILHGGGEVCDMKSGGSQEEEGEMDLDMWGQGQPSPEATSSSPPPMLGPVPSCRCLGVGEEELVKCSSSLGQQWNGKVLSGGRDWEKEIR
ncbi:hypothetical protein [Oryza sativa Japonica Group]|uniref:Uncharacterized protein n=1 Tax=Oryza sativa subsp. japonica TaxID=39947 RepID=Q5JKA4_ORYSJ|nr:hypothetical protein [Oryza sativa Japonica Group]BAD88103.1 hypothetical protein [Oryza sativa Japonica Group]